MATKKITKAVEQLKKGKLVIYPTESSYALGGDYTNRDVIEKISELKKRPENKEYGVIISSPRMAKNYATLNEIEEKILKELMPAPLTLVARRNIPDALSREIAFRIPSNKIALDLVKTFKKPVIATSANLSGERPIFNPKTAIEKFPKVHIINEGVLDERVPSTIIRVYRGYLEILRKGSYPLQKIYKVVGTKLL